MADHEKYAAKIRELEETEPGLTPAARNRRSEPVQPAPGELPWWMKQSEPDAVARDGVFVGAAPGTHSSEGSSSMHLGRTVKDVRPVIPDDPHAAPKDTIYFVNGITTTAEGQYSCMHQIANRCDANVVGIHSSTYGGVPDTFNALRSKQHDPDNRAAETVRGLVEENIKEGRDIHLAGHSRGGLTISHALNDVRVDLLRPDPQTGQVRSVAEVEKMMSHVKVETYGAAAYTYPDGPRYVHNVNDLDFVPNSTGLNFPLNHPGRGACVNHFKEPHDPHSMEVYLSHRAPFPADAPSAEMAAHVPSHSTGDEGPHRSGEQAKRSGMKR